MKNRIENISLPPWPGDFPFSFTYMLAASLTRAGYPEGWVRLCGASAFAFRIWAEVKTQCPSATSVFDFALLKKGVELCGYECGYISRLWREQALEAERREQAHRAITEAVDRGVAPVVWDIGIPEWGLITGYDDDARQYETLSIQNKRDPMPYEQLGRREIPILSVSIPGPPRQAGPMALARESLAVAVDHARGREWEDRPAYENGLDAYPAWAALIKSIDQTGFSSWYYASFYALLRRCAAAYLRELAADDASLLAAADAYGRVAKALMEARDIRNDPSFPAEAMLDGMQAAILRAWEAEKEGVDRLEAWLK